MDDFDLNEINLDEVVADQAKREAEARKRQEEERKRREEEEARRRKEADDKRAEWERKGGGSPSSSSADKPKFEALTFDDVIGMDDAKRELMEAIILPMKFGHVYERYNKRPVKGCLLYGPPGNGKTLLGKATAHQIATLSGKEYNEEAFSYYSATDFLNMYVGATEANIRKAFDEARRFKDKYGYKKVIFMDEPDSLFVKRGSRNGDCGVSEQAVTTLLTELDGMKELGAFVIFATNRPDRMDDAITRPGRIDRKVYCGRPTAKNCEDMFAYYLKKTCVNDAEALAKKASKLLMDEKLKFAEIDTDDGETHRFCLRDIRSGAMIAGLVDQAVGAAIMRDIENDASEGFVTELEIKNAIEKEYRMSVKLNHNDAIYDLIGDRKVTAYRRV